MYDTLTAYLDHWVDECADDAWLRDRHGDEITEWTWKQVQDRAEGLFRHLREEFAG